MAKILDGGALVEKIVSTVTSGTPITLTVSSATIQHLTGSTAQTIVLPDATTMKKGVRYVFKNRSSALLTVEYDDNTTAVTGVGGAEVTAYLLDATTSNGTWDFSTLVVGGASLVYSSGLLSSAPSFPIAHGLGVVPAILIIQYEDVASSSVFENLDSQTYLSANSTNITGSVASLSISATNRLRITAVAFS